MSLVDGLRSPPHPAAPVPGPRTVCRREAVARLLPRQHRATHVLLPPPGVSTEAGTVGTAIDQRLRLAFTAAAPVDDASLIGIEWSGGIGGRGAGLPMRAAGNELAVRLTETVHRLDLDNRELPVDHGQDEEEDLARMLIAAAWHQILARTPIGFAFTPLSRGGRFRADPDVDDAAVEVDRPTAGIALALVVAHPLQALSLLVLVAGARKEDLFEDVHRNAPLSPR